MGKNELAIYATAQDRKMADAAKLQYAQQAGQSAANIFAGQNAAWQQLNNWIPNGPRPRSVEELFAELLREIAIIRQEVTALKDRMSDRQLPAQSDAAFSAGALKWSV